MKRTLLLFSLILYVTLGNATKLFPTFRYKDDSGCTFKFQVVSVANKEVNLMSASNNKNPNLVIPSTVTNKGTTYTVVRVLKESLSECDDKIRVLVFPNTIKEIGPFLFGDAMKLIVMKVLTKGGNTQGTKLSKIRLEKLVIPKSLPASGLQNSFITSLSMAGNIGLNANIEELPSFVIPWNATHFGLRKEDVTDYWQRTDISRLSEEVALEAKHNYLVSLSEKTSFEDKQIFLKALQKNDEIAQKIIANMEEHGITKEEYVAALNNRYSSNTIQTTTPSSPSSPSNVIFSPNPQFIKRPSSDVDINLPSNATNNSNTFAVIFANEDYQEEVEVEYALNDGEMFKEYCNKVLGIPEDNIHLRKNATKNNMIAEISWMKKVADAYSGQAKFIVFYAGHGIPDEKTGSAYLLPVDGIGTEPETAYSLASFYKTLGTLPVANVTVFIDACFSGSKRGEGMLASARGIAIKAKPQAPQGKMVVFSAAQGDETAYPFKEKEHGLFTYYLLKKLKETKGNVTYGELSTYLQTEVKRKSIVANSKSQTPTVNPSQSVANSWKNMMLK